MSMYSYETGKFEEYFSNENNNAFYRIWAAIYTGDDRFTIEALASLSKESSSQGKWAARSRIALAAKILTMGHHESCEKLLSAIDEIAFDDDQHRNFFLSLFGLLHKLVNNRVKDPTGLTLPRGIALIGDSHTLSISSVASENFTNIHYLPGTTLRLLSVKTESAQKLAVKRATILSLKNHTIMFSFGEIDSRFIYSHSIQKGFNLVKHCEVAKCGLEFLSQNISPYQEVAIFSLPPINERLMANLSEMEKKIAIENYEEYSTYFNQCATNLGFNIIEHRLDCMNYLIDHAHFSGAYYLELFRDLFGDNQLRSKIRLD